MTAVQHNHNFAWLLCLVVLIFVGLSTLVRAQDEPAQEPEPEQQAHHHEILRLKDSDIYNQIGGEKPALVLFYFEVDSIRLDRYRKAFLKLATLVAPETSVVLGMADLGLNPGIKEGFADALAEQDKQFKMFPKVAFFPAYSSAPELFHAQSSTSYEISAEELQTFLDKKLRVGLPGQRVLVGELKHNQHRDFANVNEKGEGLEVWRTWVVLILGIIGISTFLILTSKLKRERRPVGSHRTD